MTLERGALLAALGGLVVVGCSALWLVHQRNDARAAHAQASLDLSNTRAAADTTRERYRDSVTRIVERLAVQTTLVPDAVDRLLKQNRIALDSMRGVIRALAARGQSTGDVVTIPGAAGGDSVRRGTFDVRQEPYTAHAVVELPARGHGSIDLSVAIDTIPLTLRPSCGAPDANGIRDARVSVSAPPWVAWQLVRVEQDSAVCRSPALERAGEVNATARDRRARLALVIGYGLTAAPTLPVHVEQRAFIGVAIAKPLPLPRWLPLPFK